MLAREGRGVTESGPSVVVCSSTQIMMRVQDHTDRLACKSHRPWLSNFSRRFLNNWPLWEHFMTGLPAFGGAESTRLVSGHWGSVSSSAIGSFNNF